MSRYQVLQADWLVVNADQVLRQGALLLDGGVVAEVFDDIRTATQSAEDHGIEVQVFSGVLAPGWVNAHCHLELSHLQGRVSGEGGFFDWVRRLMAAKGQTPKDAWGAAVTMGASRLLQTGCTFVGDIDSVGASSGLPGPLPIGIRAYREVLDGHQQERTADATAWIAEPLSAEFKMLEGIAPHASFTVSPVLLANVAALAQARDVPITIHWAETEEEVHWLESGEGPLSSWLGPSPCRSGLSILAAQGLLNKSTSLVHGNCPQPGEMQAIAAAGATLVHCPGSHQFFERGRFPLHEYLEAGVVIALGTDSWASNDDLSMAREVALLRQAHPEVSAQSAFRMATEYGAAAVGLSNRIGRLQQGYQADIQLVRLSSDSAGAVLNGMTQNLGEVDGLWVAGQVVAEFRGS